MSIEARTDITGVFVIRCFASCQTVDEEIDIIAENCKTWQQRTYIVGESERWSAFDICFIKSVHVHSQVAPFCSSDISPDTCQR